ncbi:hypothetical protein SMD10_24565, partial [Consotaella sp. CSK11QG-6]
MTPSGKGRAEAPGAAWAAGSLPLAFTFFVILGHFSVILGLRPEDPDFATFATGRCGLLVPPQRRWTRRLWILGTEPEDDDLGIGMRQ